MFWRGVWGYLPANIVQGVVGFLAIILFTRLLSPEDFGRYALAVSVVTLSHVAVFSWLEAAMARFWAAQTPGAAQAHFASLYRTAFILGAAFLVVVGLAVWLLPADPLFKLALAAGLAGAPARCMVKLAQERFRAEGEVGKSARLDMAVTAGGLTIGVGFALAGAGAAAPLLGLGLAPLAALPFVLPGELKQARGGAFEAGRVREYALYGYPIAASLALTVVLASTDRFLLAVYMDEAAVGAYHASYSIANRTLDVLFLWLGTAGQPALVMALERGGMERLKVAAREQLSTLLLVGLPAAAGVALVARPLSEVLIGEELRTAAANVTPWIALSALLFGLTAYYFGQAFTLGKKTRRLLIAMAIPAIRMLRDNLIEVLDSDYVRMAELKGLSRIRVLLRHALPNALVPTLNVTALNLAYLVGGVVVVEKVFSYPGFGSLLVDSLQLRDLPVIEVTVMIAALVYISANLLADIAAILLNPRLAEE